MLTDAYGVGGWVGLKYQNAYGCLRRVLVCGLKISKCLRMLTVVAGGGFGLTLTQNNSNLYNLDREKINSLQLHTKS